MDAGVEPVGRRRVGRERARARAGRDSSTPLVSRHVVRRRRPRAPRPRARGARRRGRDRSARRPPARARATSARAPPATRPPRRPSGPSIQVTSAGSQREPARGRAPRPRAASGLGATQVDALAVTARDERRGDEGERHRARPGRPPRRSQRARSAPMRATSVQRSAESSIAPVAAAEPTRRRVSGRAAPRPMFERPATRWSIAWQRELTAPQGSAGATFCRGNAARRPGTCYGVCTMDAGVRGRSAVGLLVARPRRRARARRCRCRRPMQPTAGRRAPTPITSASRAVRRRRAERRSSSSSTTNPAVPGDQARERRHRRASCGAWDASVLRAQRATSLDDHRRKSAPTQRATPHGPLTTSAIADQRRSLPARLGAGAEDLAARRALGGAAAGAARRGARRRDRSRSPGRCARGASRRRGPRPRDRYTLPSISGACPAWRPFITSSCSSLGPSTSTSSSRPTSARFFSRAMRALERHELACAVGRDERRHLAVAASCAAHVSSSE